MNYCHCIELTIVSVTLLLSFELSSMEAVQMYRN